MSRFSLCGWLERVADAAQGQGESPTSGPSPSEIESQRDREILGEWHKHPGLGPSQVVGQLRRRGVKVSVHTARRVMEEAGYRPPKVNASRTTSASKRCARITCGTWTSYTGTSIAARLSH